MKIHKIKNTLRSVNDFRKYVGNQLVFDAIKSNFKIELIEHVEPGRALVIAAHGDDDCFGCGGAICQHVLAADKVKIIYLTDGSEGSEKKLSQSEKKEYAQTREKESTAAAGKLGVNDIEFWRFKDGTLAASETIIRLVVELFEKFRPEIIYLPFFLDTHNDHAAACEIIAAALTRTKMYGIKMYSYEVWSPVFANRILKIDSNIDQKKEALKQHRSQLESRNYLDAALGLAKYRGALTGAGDYAEAFFYTNSKLYLELFDLARYKKR